MLLKFCKVLGKSQQYCHRKCGLFFIKIEYLLMSLWTYHYLKFMEKKLRVLNQLVNLIMNKF